MSACETPVTFASAACVSPAMTRNDVRRCANESMGNAARQSRQKTMLQLGSRTIMEITLWQWQHAATGSTARLRCSAS
jgi:hypothetical protein